jgi:hypothetical protein
MTERLVVEYPSGEQLAAQSLHQHPWTRLRAFGELLSNAFCFPSCGGAVVADIFLHLLFFLRQPLEELVQLLAPATPYA